jgi:hypothetical protein
MVNKIKYYSQAGQDKWICELFNFKRNGFFVDIGAYDGRHLSNSLTLEEQLGWLGVCVEANEDNFAKLLFRNCRKINAAITDHTGTCFFKDNDMYGQIGLTEGREMMCRTIESVLIDCNAPSIIDYMSLDIEGGEARALSVFPFDKYKIRALTVEHNFYNSGPDNKNKIYGILTEAGYTRVKEVSAEGLHFEDWYTKTDII